MRKRVKDKLELIACAILVVTAFWFLSDSDTSYTIEQVQKDTAHEWVSNLLNGKDNMLGDEETLSYLSQSVKNFTVSINSKTNKCTVQVEYSPYIKIDDIKVNTDRIKSVRDSYLDGKINTSELRQRLNSIYDLEKIENCYQEGSELKTIELVLEKEDGELTYKSQVNFINELLKSTNIMNNIKVYSERIDLYVNGVIS